MHACVRAWMHKANLSIVHCLWPVRQNSILCVCMHACACASMHTRMCPTCRTCHAAPNSCACPLVCTRAFGLATTSVCTCVVSSTCSLCRACCTKRTHMHMYVHPTARPPIHPSARRPTCRNAATPARCRPQAGGMNADTHERNSDMHTQARTNAGTHARAHTGKHVGKNAGRHASTRAGT